MSIGFSAQGMCFDEYRGSLDGHSFALEVKRELNRAYEQQEEYIIHLTSRATETARLLSSWIRLLVFSWTIRHR